MDRELARSEGRSELDVVVERSDLIFTGEVLLAERTITSTEHEKEYISSTKVVTRPKEVLKGQSTDKIIIYSGGECGCRYQFKAGLKYVIFANHQNERYETYQCSFIKELHSADVEAIRKFVMANKQRQPTQ